MFVVKELLENSVDAKAKSICVIIRGSRPESDSDCDAGTETDARMSF